VRPPLNGSTSHRSSRHQLLLLHHRSPSPLLAPTSDAPPRFQLRKRLLFVFFGAHARAAQIGQAISTSRFPSFIAETPPNRRRAEHACHPHRVRLHTSIFAVKPAPARAAPAATSSSRRRKGTESVFDGSGQRPLAPRRVSPSLAAGPPNPNRRQRRVQTRAGPPPCSSSHSRARRPARIPRCLLLFFPLPASNLTHRDKNWKS
jgi:hypothetical protein